MKVCRRSTFNAAHRLFRKEWSDEKNELVFGKCNNPNFHGHNYVFETWLDGEIDSETGYVIGVQHSNNLVTFYKHNSALLKSVGDYVKAGEVIAIIGNSGEFSSGPHLHFELWYNGTPVNPTDYINF